MVAMCAASAVGSRSSAPSAARAPTLACQVAPASRHMSKPCRSASSLRSAASTAARSSWPASMRSHALHEARVGEAVRALGEAELFGPACRVRQLGLGAGEIAAHEADQGQVDVRRRDRVVGLKPHRVDLVLVCCGQARRGRLEVGAGGIELAAQPRHHPEQQPRSPDGTTAAPARGPRAATRAPGPPGAGRHARGSSPPGRPASRTARRRAGRSRPAAGTARSRRQRRGFDSPPRPRRGIPAPTAAAISRRSRSGPGVARSSCARARVR